MIESGQPRTVRASDEGERTNERRRQAGNGCAATPAGHDARIRLYQLRAAAGRDIFTGRKRAADRVRCAACGTKARKASHLSHAGWAVLAITGLPGQHRAVERSVPVDAICPGCVADGVSFAAA